MLEKIRECFISDKVLYTRHAHAEMEAEELGLINENEVFESIMGGKIIEDYPEDEPYPSCLIYGKTVKKRPIHVVCAFDNNENITIVITVYRPTEERWVDFERRIKL